MDRFRLEYVENEYYGTATNDGAGTYSYNDSLRSFKANWVCWGYAGGSLICLPPVDLKLNLVSQYLEDGSFNNLLSDSIFQECKQKYFIKMNEIDEGQY